MQRRSLLRAPALAFATLPFVGVSCTPSTALRAVQPGRDAVTGLSLIKVPPGFSYRALAWTGQTMTEGSATPGKHDGMGWGQGQNGPVLLRNHEVTLGTPIGGSPAVYDGLMIAPGASKDMPDGFPGFGGGVTGVALEGAQADRSIPLLAGTAQNCAGGTTPWGSWLTCEETLLRGSRLRTDQGDAKDHGYVFEVPGPGIRASAMPIIDMGFMRHEAAVVASDGNVYLTEDNGPSSGFYRMLPRNRGARVGALDEGGALQMLRARKPDGSAAGDLQAVEAGTKFDADWVNIDNPDQDPEQLTAAPGGTAEIIGGGRSGPYLQGARQGGATFRRLEGCYYSDGIVYFTDTSGGLAGRGTLWAYDLAASTLQLIYSSPSIEESNHIDNVAVSDAGLIVACEDGPSREGGGARMLALASGRAAAAIAENNIVLEEGNALGMPAGDYRGAEWAGATFSPDGTTLYANIQTPGVTFAITGPWDALV